uniref:Uncharacterized protein n=1 Tax=Meloidogyne floridensis TaxID=298350 RepID=A0A915NWU9_9BILA
MIINLSFNKILPLLALNLFLLKYSYGMFPPPIYPHHQYHSNPDDLVDKQIELIEKTEKKFSQMIEKVDKFKDISPKEKFKINQEEFLPIKKVEKFSSILDTFIRKQKDLNFPKSEITLNFTYYEVNKDSTNPFLEKYIEINPKLILGNALKKIAEKLPKEAIVYKELFDKLKLFWFDKVEEDLNVENENAERPLISLETPQNEKRNNFAKEWEDDTLKALSDGLQVNQPTEKPTQIISPQYTQHEFVVGLEYNSFKKIREEFERTEELIKEYMLERYKNLYERKKEIEHLRKLYNEIIEENGNLKIENYWTKHVLHFKNTDEGFETVVEKKKTIELEDINELIKNDYGASDEELTPSRILDYEASKLENNNDFRNIMLKVLWKKNKKEAPILFNLEYDKKIKIKTLIGNLKKFYEQINKISSDPPYKLWNFHNSLLNASKKVYENLNKMLVNFDKTRDLDVLESQNFKMTQEEIEIFEKHQDGEINLDKELESRFVHLNERFETWFVAEFWLKKALKDIAKFFENNKEYYTYEHDHLSSLADKIEKNMELPKEWLEEEKKFYDTKHKNFHDKPNDNMLEKSSVLIRINAGKVLLAYTRMKKIFKAFNCNDFDKQKPQILAGIFEDNIKSEADKVILEKIHERIFKL